ncbi:MAG TPA: hypothetical protein VJ780_06270 [Flavobacterium sp.]|nr:hypothetical protein [Flavobacterium sp.]
MKETDIDSMKYRKSTHLAGIDVEAIVEEKGNCILTIKQAYYERGVDVSGNKTDGYFIEFEEPVKAMVANSGNRKIINDIVKEKLGCTSAESRMLPNWKGIQIDLWFDPTRKMMGKVTGGIGVKPVVKKVISDVNALSVLNLSKTITELQSNWEKLTPAEKNLPTVIALKEKLKSSLK